MNQILSAFLPSFGLLFTFVCVVVTITYLLSRVERIARLMTIKRSARKVKVALVLIMGLLIMLASHVAVITPEGGRMNVRDMFAILAGLLGGPFVAIPVGLIGGIYRYFLGGVSALGCGVATAVAGVFGGYLYRFKQYKLPNITLKAIGTLFLLTLLMEILHFGISGLFMSKETSVEMISLYRSANKAESLNMVFAGVAMIIVNPIGVAIFMLIFRGLGLEQLRIQRLIGERERVKKAKEEIEEVKTSLEIKVKARTEELEGLTQALEDKVQKRTKELQERINQLERFRKLTVGRELKMVELKKRIKELEEKTKGF